MRYPRFALVAVLALVSVAAASGQPQAELVLHFVEIGQGDCTLIECPNGGSILVDAGSTAHGDRDAVREYVREQLDQANPRIDTVAVTHRGSGCHSSCQLGGKMVGLPYRRTLIDARIARFLTAGILRGVVGLTAMDSRRMQTRLHE